MIPAFSLERTQELIYDLNNLIDRKHLLPRIPIYLDSPLAIKAIAVYRKYSHYYDEEAKRFFNSGDDLFQFPGLVLAETATESKLINRARNPKIIIAGSGMMNGGRIMHHAARYLANSRNTLLIIGYQAHGTLGRQILEGAPAVSIMNQHIPVRCQVKAVGALSAHGDQEKLFNWLTSSPVLPKQVCLNHGEPAASEALKIKLTKSANLATTVAFPNLSLDI